MDDKGDLPRFGLIRRLLPYAIGVPAITMLYTLLLLFLRSTDRSRYANPLVRGFWDFVGMVFFAPAHYFGKWFPFMARWQHGLGIVLLFGALWGIGIVWLGCRVARRLRRTATEAKTGEGMEQEGVNEPQRTQRTQEALCVPTEDRGNEDQDAEA